LIAGAIFALAAPDLHAQVRPKATPTPTPTPTPEPTPTPRPDRVEWTIAPAPRQHLFPLVEFYAPLMTRHFPDLEWPVVEPFVVALEEPARIDPDATPIPLIVHVTTGRRGTARSTKLQWTPRRGRPDAIAIEWPSERSRQTDLSTVKLRSLGRLAKTHTVESVIHRSSEIPWPSDEERQMSGAAPTTLALLAAQVDPTHPEIVRIARSVRRQRAELGTGSLRPVTEDALLASLAWRQCVIDRDVTILPKSLELMSLEDVRWIEVPPTRELIERSRVHRGEATLLVAAVLLALDRRPVLLLGEDAVWLRPSPDISADNSLAPLRWKSADLESEIPMAMETALEDVDQAEGRTNLIEAYEWMRASASAWQRQSSMTRQELIEIDLVKCREWKIGATLTGVPDEDDWVAPPTPTPSEGIAPWRPTPEPEKPRREETGLHAKRIKTRGKE